MDVLEDLIGIVGGAILGGCFLTLLVLLLGFEPGWLVFAIGAVPGAVLGYRYADVVVRWWWIWGP
jgi:hypothetical protein